MAKVEVVGLADADRLTVTRFQPFRVTVEDWRNSGDVYRFTVQAADVAGAVKAAGAVLARRTTDRIVAVVPVVEGGR